MHALVIHPEVAGALESDRPIVALESAVITAGLPSTSHKLAAAAGVNEWNSSEPANLEAARAMMRAVRESGAVPALTAILEGKVHIGLPEEALPQFVSKTGGAKASVRDFAVLIARKGSAGTTVAGTLRACSMPGDHRIRVMATGGIGGVHHTWPATPDISADLLEIAHTPMAIICSGAKSVLNLRATVEALEVLSVPVIGYQTDKLAAFYLREFENLRCQTRLDTPDEIATLCEAHWHTVRSTTGIIIAQAVAGEVALDPIEFDLALSAAMETAGAAGTSGGDVTPQLLLEVARLTEGKSLDANISLLVGNARLAGRIAAAMKET